MPINFALSYLQPRPQGFLCFQNGGASVESLTRMLKYSKDREIFGHVTSTIKWRFRSLFTAIGSLVFLFLAI